MGRERFTAIHTGDAALDRVQQDLARVVNRLVDGPLAEAKLLTVEASAGLNRFAHGLQRSPRAVFVTPTGAVTVTDSQADNSYPDRELWLTFSGAVSCQVLVT
jgi:hypothetical protein